MKATYIMAKEDADNMKAAAKATEETPASSSTDVPQKAPALPKPLLAICGPSESTCKAYAAAMNRLANQSYCSTPPGPPPPMAKPPTMPPTTISKAAAKAAVTPALFTNICMYACIDNIFRQNNINISMPERQ